MPSVPQGPVFQISSAGAFDLTAIQALAREIWFRVYPGIISEEQIEYMLKSMYEPAVMGREMDAEAVTYVKLLVAGELRGFAAYGPGETPGGVLLHKLYLHPDLHGRGFGSEALAEIESAARAELSAQHIVLRVNRQNRKAIEAYTRNGYQFAGEICSDIGGGFVMDDYWMRKELG